MSDEYENFDRVEVLDLLEVITGSVAGCTIVTVSVGRVMSVLCVRCVSNLVWSAVDR